MPYKSLLTRRAACRRYYLAHQADLKAKRKARRKLFPDQAKKIDLRHYQRHRTEIIARNRTRTLSIPIEERRRYHREYMRSYRAAA